MTPLERAALAVCQVRGQDPDGAIISFPDGKIEVPIDVARATVRAVLQAIRDIDLQTQDDTEIAMLMNGCAVLPEHDEPLQEDALNCWQAMIDAALEEG